MKDGKEVELENENYSGFYWKDRCKAVERRMDQLEDEIRKLKGLRKLTDKQIEEWNENLRDK